MIRSGKTIDEQSYLSFFYCCEKPYSSDGWFLVGHAGRCVDGLGTEYLRSKLVPWVLPLMEPQAFRTATPVFQGLSPT
jgi:hypothetical protein